MIDRNENRPGYKKTKVGWIPEEWEIAPLIELGNWKGGGTPSKHIAEYWSNEDIPWASSQDIKTRILLSTCSSISRCAVEESATNIIPADSLLMVVRSGILRHTFPITRTVFPVAINQDIKALTLNSGISISFLQNLIQHLGCDILKRCAKVGTTVESIEYEWLKKYSIPLPPLPEQKRIAEILSTWDEAIEQTRELIEAKKCRKKALMQQLLTGKKRLPGFNKSWKRCKFRDVFERVVRKNTGGNTNVLTISGSSGLINQEEYFNKQVASKDLSGYYLLQFGEFAYNKSRSNGYPLGAIKRLKGYPVGVVSTLYFCFKLIHELDDAEFYEHYFEGDQHNQELYTIAHEGARCHGLLNISAHDIMDTQLRIPDSEEQRALADVLNEAEAEIKTTENKFATLKKQKRGLMQKLLTGEVRVRI